MEIIVGTRDFFLAYRTAGYRYTIVGARPGGVIIWNGVRPVEYCVFKEHRAFLNWAKVNT